MFEDYDNVKFIIAFSDPNQPYTCQEWGEMPDGGASQIISDAGSNIWHLFQSGGAFPSTFLVKELTVYQSRNIAMATGDAGVYFMQRNKF